MLGEGIEPSMGFAHGYLSAARLPFTPPQLLKTPGEGLEPSSPVPKTGALPLDDPGLFENEPGTTRTCALKLRKPAL